MEATVLKVLIIINRGVAKGRATRQAVVGGK